MHVYMYLNVYSVYLFWMKYIFKWHFSTHSCLLGIAFSSLWRIHAKKRDLFFGTAFAFGPFETLHLHADLRCLKMLSEFWKNVIWVGYSKAVHQPDTLFSLALNVIKLDLACWFQLTECTLMLLLRCINCNPLFKH